MVFLFAGPKLLFALRTIGSGMTDLAANASILGKISAKQKRSEVSSACNLLQQKDYW
jgi:hypothetical protein